MTREMFQISYGQSGPGCTSLTASLIIEPLSPTRDTLSHDYEKAKPIDIDIVCDGGKGRSRAQQREPKHLELRISIIKQKMHRMDKMV